MSNRTEHHDKIQQITAKLIELNSNFANAKQLTSIDIELLRKYAVDLYDKILLLEPEKPVNVQPVAPKVEPLKVQEVKVEPKPIVTTKPEPIVEEKTVPPLIEVKKEVPLPPNIEVKKEESPVVEAPKPIEVPKPIVVETPKTPEIKPAFEEKKETTEKGKDDSLNTSLQQPETEDLASKLGQTPIHDLKKAISINKKFEFISQLFEGDHEGYTKSIHYLNGLNSKDEAMTFFNSLKKERNWDEENKRYIEFADLVNRRFM